MKIGLNKHWVQMRPSDMRPASLSNPEDPGNQNAGETAIGSGNDRLEGGRLFRDPQVPDSPTDRLESNCWPQRNATGNVEQQPRFQPYYFDLDETTTDAVLEIKELTYIKALTPDETSGPMQRAKEDANIRKVNVIVTEAVADNTVAQRLRVLA
ncbi:hypothetical protein An04g03560 [Aspergillus niger]|uniref:Uncharacterized protein n=2 Tax=Aspergillus niger TaxID=5061 RepID=A2QIH7_ASPNC|nr:hypothetical protein An04g03560 [Aspergillus niger]CAK38621.1 hypothetical protein An04g03560 [Aspergillus niger]